jgi:hypothetical protein
MIAALFSMIDFASLIPLLAVTSLWYAVPLVVTVSLVCAATRHEEMGPIMNHALRFGGWIVVFMAAVMVVLWLMGLMV